MTQDSIGTSTSLLTPFRIFASAILLRLIFFSYGLLQDAYGPMPYTDIDYFVFTDAARYVYHGLSPYERETYRYTPLLAWLLLPTALARHNAVWFSFGKLLFSVTDIIAGWLIYRLLQSPSCGSMRPTQALKFASIWLLNPMVATISTRGSSEGLLGVMVIALLWAVLSRRFILAGVLLGLAVHFKIYPFIYGVSILFHLTPELPQSARSASLFEHLKAQLLHPPRLTLLLTSLLTFTILNIIMYSLYSTPFLQETYLHHLSRLDHRHNFSPYNTLLYLSSSPSTPNADSKYSSAGLPLLKTLRPESLAFLPQILLTTTLLPPLATPFHNASTASTTSTTTATNTTASKKIGKPTANPNTTVSLLPLVMLAQTYAFVSLNKVCTSQYFLWYLVLLPFYLPFSRYLSSPRLGLAVLLLWVGAQGLWLWGAWRTEFLGKSAFVGERGLVGSTGGMWGASIVFLGVNCLILGHMVGDIGVLRRGGSHVGEAGMDSKKKEL